ncbi:hypothetical protein Y1Q_0011259 [Alligator mississippiensis]|uniref:Uncharacterized protein n=1 Tax=Alligator mississippiensis TaxID=8496 RepID=A0A151N842_ALLMI|nr:hypothetical protein Y1Q_0011259 [Alligator mississippiensis]
MKDKKITGAVMHNTVKTELLWAGPGQAAASPRRGSSPPEADKNILPRKPVQNQYNLNGSGYFDIGDEDD